MSVVPSTTMSVPLRPPGCYTLQGQWRFHIISTGFPAGRRNLGLRVPSGRISRPSIELEPLPPVTLASLKKQSEAGIKDFERVLLLPPFDVVPIDILPSLINFQFLELAASVEWVQLAEQLLQPNQGSNSVSLGAADIFATFSLRQFSFKQLRLSKDKIQILTVFGNLFKHS